MQRRIVIPSMILATLLASICLILLACCEPQPVASPVAQHHPATQPRSPATAPARPAVTSQPPHEVAVVLPDGTRVSGPPGTAIEIEDDGGGEVRNESAESRGGTITGQGDEIAGSVSVKPGDVHLGSDGGPSSGSSGGLESRWSLKGVPPGTGVVAGYGLAGLLIVAGVVLLVLPLVYPAAAAIPFRSLIGWVCVIAGVSLGVLAYIAASPVLMACLAAAAVLGLGGFGLWSMVKHAGITEANAVTAEAAVLAINDLKTHDPEVYKWVKSRVDHWTDSSDDAKVYKVVKAIKEGA